MLREVTPDVPTTTNLMLSTGTKWMDYFSWADDLDVIANDHYTRAHDPEAHVELAFSADLTRGVAGGDPWMLMEHSTSAVNWQPRNRTKRPGEMLRHSLAHVARGADAVMFFQWRQSAAGAEKFHSAMLPHAGTDTDVWRNTVALGDALTALSEVEGSRVRARAAIVFDYPAWWGTELDSHPSAAVTYPDRVLAHYRALWQRNVTVDIVRPSADLSGYSLVVVPALYLVTDADASNIARAAERGASVLVTYFSGIADEHDHIRLGGYPGAFRELLGVRTEEFWALQDGEIADPRRRHAAPTSGPSRRTSLPARRRSARSPTATSPAGPPSRVDPSARAAAWYLGTRLDADGLQGVTDALIEEAGLTPELDGVEAVRRVADDGRSWLFVLNHTDRRGQGRRHRARAAPRRARAGTLVVPAWCRRRGARRLMADVDARAPG